MNKARKPKFQVCFIGYSMGDGLHYGGQETKTAAILQQLSSHYGPDEVFFVNTCNWRKRPLQTYFLFLRGAVASKRIVLSAAHKGVSVFSFFLSILNVFLHRDLFYAVVGGWLPSLIDRKTFLGRRLKKYRGIFVETNSLLGAMKARGFTNVYLLFNVRYSPILCPSDLKKPTSVFRFCIFSRIDEKKGIEDAVSAIIDVNEMFPNKKCTLTLFGGIQDSYRDNFAKLQENFPPFITYGGLIPPDLISKTLLNYDVLLFPTHYQTEGFPGTILDGLLNGLVIISKDIASTEELLEGRDFAFLYPTKQFPSLEFAISHVLSFDCERLLLLKEHSLLESQKYNYEKSFSVFFQVLDKNS